MVPPILVFASPLLRRLLFTRCHTSILVDCSFDTSGKSTTASLAKPCNPEVDPFQMASKGLHLYSSMERAVLPDAIHIRLGVLMRRVHRAVGGPRSVLLGDTVRDGGGVLVHDVVVYGSGGHFFAAQTTIPERPEAFFKVIRHACHRGRHMASTRTPVGSRRLDYREWKSLRTRLGCVSDFPKLGILIVVARSQW